MPRIRGSQEHESGLAEGLLEESSQRRLEEFRRLNELILGAAGEGIYGLDCDGLTTFVNPAAAEVLGWPVEELIGRPMHAILHHSRPDGSPYPREECPIYAAFNDGEVHTVSDEVFWRQDGSSFPVEYVSTPIRERGRLVGAVVVFRNLTELKQSEERLKTALAEVEHLKNRLEAENVYLQEEIETHHSFKKIIGGSPAIKKVLAAVETVAPTKANVMITGETGTGKELIARALHKLSERKDRPLIKVNCASIPRELFESEFFGHVKGAFTGALRTRSGRFELADKGTLFLDEVGEIPLEMQSKLLRVLQEGQFERIGDERTRNVDVRVVAATNRDLAREVETGRFRSDLYYRINVFPIEVPPLRERREDVPSLAAFFVEQAAAELRRPVPKLTQGDVAWLQEYDWPGNVRELRNVIERAVITAREGRLGLDLPLAERSPRPAEPLASPSHDTHTREGEVQPVLPEAEMRRRERDNLLAALEQTGWQVYGDRGAAALLGVKPSTLASRIKKMGLKKPE